MDDPLYQRPYDPPPHKDRNNSGRKMKMIFVWVIHCVFTLAITAGCLTYRDKYLQTLQGLERQTQSNHQLVRAWNDIWDQKERARLDLNDMISIVNSLRKELADCHSKQPTPTIK